MTALNHLNVQCHHLHFLIYYSRAIKLFVHMRTFTRAFQKNYIFLPWPKFTLRSEWNRFRSGTCVTFFSGYAKNALRNLFYTNSIYVCRNRYMRGWRWMDAAERWHQIKPGERRVGGRGGKGGIAYHNFCVWRVCGRWRRRRRQRRIMWGPSRIYTKSRRCAISKCVFFFKRKKESKIKIIKCHKLSLRI